MVNSYFEIEGKDKREEAIKKLILDNMCQKEAAGLQERIFKIVECFEGRDLDALSVLIHAAEQGKTEEFLKELESHYKDNLQYIHPEARRMITIPGAVRAERFILDLYEKLGGKPK
ncbi:MAG: hypothetical protein WC413_03845 [Candidatus Nanoarchaeia archaeon]